MKKVLLLVVCMLVVPALAYGNGKCPKYEFGYKGDAKACIFGITFPIVGAKVVLTTPEFLTMVTDAAGTYRISAKVNNCTNEFGFYHQSWKVTIDADALGIPAVKSCEAQADFICCCSQCAQSIIKTCKLLYNFCCVSG